MQTIEITDLSLGQIAAIIRKNWLRVNYAANPYLDAMMHLDNIYDKYCYDDGKIVVLYFLANASAWRGDIARQVKAELKSRIA